MASVNPAPTPRKTAHPPGRFRRCWAAIYGFIVARKVWRWLRRGLTVTLVVGLIINNILLYIDKSNLTRERDDLRETTTRQASRHDQSDRDLAALRDSHHVLAAARAALEQSNSDANVRISQLQQQNQTLFTANSTLTATKVALENAKATATKLIQQLQVRYDTLTKDNRDLVASNADLKQQLSELGAQVQRTDQANRDLSAAIKECRIKAETPIDRPVPMAVQTSGTITVPSELSWGSGDIFLSVCTSSSFFTDTIRLTSKVGDDTKTHIAHLGDPILSKAILIKGLRGELTFEVVKVTFIRTGAFNLYHSPATVQFKASYRPLTVAAPTPPAK